MNGEIQSGVGPGPEPTREELQQRLDAVSRIARTVNLALPLRQLFGLIAQAACEVMGYDYSAVMLVDREKKVLKVEGAYGVPNSYIELLRSKRAIPLYPSPRAAGPTTRAFHDLQPVAVTDIRLDPSFVASASIAVDYGYESCLAVPLRVISGPLGVLKCYTKTRHEFSQSELTLIETFADQAAIAIHAASVHERERASIHLLERAESIHSELTKVILNDGGLDSIASSLARLLRATVSIEDVSGKVLAITRFGPSPVNVPDNEARSHPLLREALVRQGGTRAIEEIPPLPDLDMEGHSLVAPIIVGAELVGRIWATGLADEPDMLEHRAVEHGATVSAMELLKQRTAREVEWRLRGDLLGDLLAGEVPDDAAFHARARYLGHNLEIEHSMLVLKNFSPPVPSPWHGPFEDLTENDQLHQILALTQDFALGSRPAPIAGIRGDHVVLLWPNHGVTGQPSASEIARSIHFEASRNIHETPIVVVVGQECRTLADYRSAYQEARTALQLSDRLGHRNGVISLAEMGAYRLLLRVPDLDYLASFMNSTLGPLLDYDTQHGTDLVATLRVFLNHDCATTAAAEALFIHTNTLTYRIHRIEEIVGLRLRSMNDLLQAKLALMIDDVLSASLQQR